MQLTFLGLGPMGAAMAARLLAAGHEVTVWNRTSSKAGPLVDAGARQAESPGEAAAHADVVLSSLAEDNAVRAVILGEEGALAAMDADAIHVSLSTISTALSRELTEAHAGRGQGFVSAPVLGRPPAAQAGQLFVMAAGGETYLQRVRSLLDVLGQRVFTLGPDPQGANLMKLMCNFLIFSTIEQFGEVFAAGQKGGLDPETVFQVLTESFFTAPVHKNYGRLILDGRFDPPGGSVKLAAKDTRLMLAAAEEVGAPLPLASLVRDRFLSAIAQGEGDLDFAILARHAARDAGLKE